MATVQTQHLAGIALDWAVATCLGLPLKLDPMGFKTGSEAGYWIWRGDSSDSIKGKIGQGYSPSTNWEQAGEIIDSANVSLRRVFNHGQPAMGQDAWRAHIDFINGKLVLGENTEYGSTPLIAAMRCLVHSKMGSEIEVPSLLIMEAEAPASKTA